jgi:hypothetical protein
MTMGVRSNIRFLLVLCCVFITNVRLAQRPWSGNTTPSYPELISHLKTIDLTHAEIENYAMGQSDYGEPIYLLIINGTGDSSKTFEKARNSTTLLVNNAIHPGEPDGVNACLLWIDNWIKNRKETAELPVIAIISAYNVGGMFNRSSTSRANQNGPEEYGFRGNARNLDLNRDFIKADAENTMTFYRIFHSLDPDVFIDNHVSNGADYPYTLTFISSVKERMAPSLRKLTYGQLIPYMTKVLRKHKWELFPYVELKGKTPEEGIVAFNDLPRYAMGYANLFNTISFTVETHMLKPFPERVKATYDFMNELICWMGGHSKSIEADRAKAKLWAKSLPTFYYNYNFENTKDSIWFKGYEAEYVKNETTQLAHLNYNRTKPYEKYIPHFNRHVAIDSMRVSDYYVLSAQEKKAKEILTFNQIQYTELKNDTIIELGVLVVKDFKSLSKPYEGHFKHTQIELAPISSQYVRLKKGDWIIPTKQDNSLFIHSVLWPESEDSFTAWNFFDSYLQQKEYFSSYVFKDKIDEIFAKNSNLKETFEQKLQSDSSFASSEWDQLYYIYANSPYFEQTFMRLPVYIGNY